MLVFVISIYFCFFYKFSFSLKINKCYFDNNLFQIKLFPPSQKKNSSHSHLKSSVEKKNLELLSVVECCWRLLNVVECCWVLLSDVEWCWVMLSVFWMWLSVVECCCAILSVVEFLWIIECCWVLLSVIECCWVLLSVIKCY